MEMVPVEGYRATSWAAGYGDYTMKPDLTTLRRIPWLEGTALVLCDVLDHHTQADVPHSPRAVLKKQIARLKALGMKALMASELEFFLFLESYEEARAMGLGGLTPISPYNEPDIPNNGGIDPWCVDQSWQNMLAALTAGKKPTYDKIGIAYMLMGDGEVSNITPSGTKEQGQWIAGLKAHLMLLVPDHSMFDYLPTEPDGGPWIMWKGTPYAHVMIPIDSYPNP